MWRGRQGGCCCVGLIRLGEWEGRKGWEMEGEDWNGHVELRDILWSLGVALEVGMGDACI